MPPRRRLGILICAVVLAWFARANNVTVSYGENNMPDPDIVARAPSPAGAILRTASTGAVTLVPTETILSTQSGLRLGVMTPDFCPGSELLHPDELSLPLNTCSGALITPRRVITAAHCLKVASGYDDTAAGNVDEAKISILLGHDQPLYRDPAVGAPPHLFARYDGQIVAVSKTIYCRMNRQTDIAVLQLLAPADSKYAPLTRRDGPPAASDEVHLISTPKGLPVHISTCIGEPLPCTQAKITEVGPTLFRAPLDSYSGSSGGAVVDATGDLLGIFSGGLAHARGAMCDTNFTYPDSCLGDVISRVDQLSSELFDDNSVMPDIPCDFSELPDYPNTCE